MSQQHEPERLSDEYRSPAANGSESLDDGLPERLKRRVQRHSPDRLLRRKLILPGDIIVSAEKHKGRLMVRVESPDVER